MSRHRGREPDKEFMSASINIPYRLGRWVLRVALGFYFTRIEKFHGERVPLTGPVLFTSNHPNSVTDAFVIGTAVPRKVNFVATVRLFHLTPFRWLLARCGVIPINRVKDDPRAMRTVLDTFEACFGVLERGEAIGIFPEGVTHDDPQLKSIKTGAARLALELEHRHRGALGLRIAPVGLTFSAKERYRSDVLVHFGDPICVADYLAGYPEKKRTCIQVLTGEIERRIESLILHLPQLERARVVEAVKRLYLDRLLVGNRIIHEPVLPKAGELMLTQAIANAVDYTYDQHPERAASFTQKLNRYEHGLRRLNLSDDELGHFRSVAHVAWQSLGWTLMGVVFFPVALFGWLHLLLPVLLMKGAIKYFVQTPLHRTHVSTTAILAGIVSFGVCYGGFIAAAHALFGLPASLWYALSLPVASLVAHYYLLSLLRFILGVRSLLILLRAPAAGRRLQAWRRELIAEIESARWQVPTDILTHNRIS
jgi:glycerol-3-phosphate O-acyltransferase / dihydroxyacetone phosphate acyltransferase